ncbi:T9SS type A sorting domain-containing protein [Constantimarinum furrinae]|uniref:Secretion system C-terminal sorting domain-containing protein n=1 Tax=Constantimarinum furrinae TaxID=2562285 RepID=A0A7G8PW69_9FLAO|nr:T9SS type A sorting domain-containing protein [Constantimarinum furrinae]QNJ98585.1 hypothetical protein ALE3EI_2038 [Constantimarinum furrinae]
MKKNTLICSMVWLVSCVFGFAQIQPSQPTLEDLLYRLQENHMGSISEIFTSEEIERLQGHFNAQNPAEESQRVVNHFKFFTTENTKGNFSSINPQNLGMTELIAPSPLNEFEGAGALQLDGESVVVVDNGNNFYHVYPNGDYEFIAQIMPQNGQSFTGLEFASDGTLYGIATDGMGSTRLYEIDEATFTAIPVGGDNGLVVGIALGRDANNELYSYDIDSDMVYRINRLTGLTTLLGSLGFDSNFGQGMSYNEEDGQLYISAFNNGTFKPELRTVNTTTGLSALVGTIVPSMTLQFAYMTAYDPTLGISENGILDLAVYPNPASNQVKITSSVSMNEIIIYNTLGQELIRKSIDGTEIILDISELSSGIYLLSVFSGDASSTRRLVKQ